MYVDRLIAAMDGGISIVVRSLDGRRCCSCASPPACSLCGCIEAGHAKVGEN